MKNSTSLVSSFCKVFFDLGMLSPQMLTFLFCIIFNMKSLSNMIPFNFLLKIKFDWDFIFKTDAKKKVRILGEFSLAGLFCI